MGSEEWDLKPQPWDQGSQTVGLGSAGFFRDQGSSCTIFVGSGNKIGHAFGIKGGLLPNRFIVNLKTK